MSFVCFSPSMLDMQGVAYLILWALVAGLWTQDSAGMYICFVSYTYKRCPEVLETSNIITWRRLSIYLSIYGWMDACMYVSIYLSIQSLHKISLRAQVYETDFMCLALSQAKIKLIVRSLSSNPISSTCICSEQEATVTLFGSSVLQQMDMRIIKQ